MFPKIGGKPQNGWFIMENPIKMENPENNGFQMDFPNSRDLFSGSMLNFVHMGNQWWKIPIFNDMTLENPLFSIRNAYSFMVDFPASHVSFPGSISVN